MLDHPLSRGDDEGWHARTPRIFTYFIFSNSQDSNRHCERSEAIHAATNTARMDCFVASLPCANASRLSQAMTARCRFAISPLVCARLGRLVSPSPFRGRRECRAPDAPAAACAVVESTRVSHHGHTGKRPAFPAQWFYGLFRALPGDRACLPPSLMELPPPT